VIIKNNFDYVINIMSKPLCIKNMVKVGRRRTEDGRLETEDGGRRTEDGRWKMEDGSIPAA